MSFQLYKAMNSGKDMKQESGTYGTDICFPGNQVVAMANGSKKLLKTIKPGDKVITVDPATKRSAVVTVTQLKEHEAKNYALTKLLVIAADETANEIKLTTKVLQATPNHPMITTSKKKMSEVVIGDEVVCFDKNANTYQTYKVFNKTEAAGGTQKVYNMVVNGGSTFVVNGVIVMQK
jgi:predicted ribosome-associated RNA-binding protein Tma20